MTLRTMARQGAGRTGDRVGLLLDLEEGSVTVYKHSAGLALA